jgi:hypothetical protein
VWPSRCRYGVPYAHGVSTRRDEHSALRVVRGGLLAVGSAAIAVGAHTLADGGLPDPAMTLLLTVMIGWLGTASAAKTQGPVKVVAVLGAAQLVMHVGLSTLATHETHTATSGVMSGVTMTATHVAATLVTALLVAHAESMLQAVVAAMRLLLPLIRQALPVLDTVAVTPVVHAPEAGPLVSVLFRRVLGRRGPPAYS